MDKESRTRRLMRKEDTVAKFVRQPRPRLQGTYNQVKWRTVEDNQLETKTRQQQIDTMRNKNKRKTGLRKKIKAREREDVLDPRSGSVESIESSGRSGVGQGQVKMTIVDDVRDEADDDEWLPSEYRQRSVRSSAGDQERFMQMFYGYVTPEPNSVYSNLGRRPDTASSGRSSRSLMSRESTRSRASSRQSVLWEREALQAAAEQRLASLQDDFSFMEPEEQDELFEAMFGDLLPQHQRKVNDEFSVLQKVGGSGKRRGRPRSRHRPTQQQEDQEQLQQQREQQEGGSGSSSPPEEQAGTGRPSSSRRSNRATSAHRVRFADATTGNADDVVASKQVGEAEGTGAGGEDGPSTNSTAATEEKEDESQKGTGDKGTEEREEQAEEAEAGAEEEEEEEDDTGSVLEVDVGAAETTDTFGNKEHTPPKSPPRRKNRYGATARFYKRRSEMELQIPERLQQESRELGAQFEQILADEGQRQGESSSLEMHKRLMNPIIVREAKDVPEELLSDSDWSWSGSEEEEDMVNGDSEEARANNNVRRISQSIGQSIGKRQEFFRTRITDSNAQEVEVDLSAAYSRSSMMYTKPPDRRGQKVHLQEKLLRKGDSLNSSFLQATAPRSPKKRMEYGRWYVPVKYWRPMEQGEPVITQHTLEELRHKREERVQQLHAKQMAQAEAARVKNLNKVDGMGGRGRTSSRVRTAGSSGRLPSAATSASSDFFEDDGPQMELSQTEREHILSTGTDPTQGMLDEDSARPLDPETTYEPNMSVVKRERIQKKFQETYRTLYAAKAFMKHLEKGHERKPYFLDELKNNQ